MEHYGTGMPQTKGVFESGLTGETIMKGEELSAHGFSSNTLFGFCIEGFSVK